MILTYAYLADNLITLTGLRDTVTDALVATATVTVSLTLRRTGLPVVGVTWPLTLAPVSGSPGNYRAQLPDTLEVVKGDRMEGVLTAVNGATVRPWPLVVRVREVR